ncbi:hypothetical protein SAMN05661091_3015 [Paenibacillus uliginis N3/975]|uniref:Uncharacterized protein n=2 Tax=Paenibacillus TaxID=44249 RepID=A0A1X7HFA8_9BACL|nr:hypothetical protein SAMN05661091_3015 [Paenibacillus uliginis N3/975]
MFVTSKNSMYEKMVHVTLARRTVHVYTPLDGKFVDQGSIITDVGVSATWMEQNFHIVH